MKKLLYVLMITAMVAMTCVGCGNGGTTVDPAGPKDIDLKGFVNTMVEKEYIVMPFEIDAQQASEMYLINTENVEDYAIAKTGRTPGIGLVVIAKAKEGKVDEVKASMEQLLQNEIGNAFYPDEQEAANQAEIMVNGQYVSLFIIHPDYKDEAIQMYKDALK